MNDEIQDMIDKWEDRLRELRTERDSLNPLTEQGKKNVTKVYLIEEFLMDLKYLREEA